ncbi:MAG: hypothetical protein GY765_34035 [bacterium]|nr:hypothetical protein [bacterium]
MEHMNSLARLTDGYLMDRGAEVLQEIDTPAFMRKECDVYLMDDDTPPTAGAVVEPDEKIINFLTIIKGGNYAPIMG